jgi:hypothetical protein
VIDRISSGDGLSVIHNQSMEDREMMQRWVQTWKEAGPKLEAIRRREIQEAENLKVLAMLESAFNHATRAMPPRPSSGLVEMQEWLAKLGR